MTTPQRAPRCKWVCIEGGAYAAVRIRPDAVTDPAQLASRFVRPAVAATGTASLVVEPSVLPVGVRETRHAFSFDRVYAPDATQDAVYASVEPLVRHFLDGFNTTIFAYGQTSSGKSYSMGMSVESEDIRALDALDERVGIIPRAAQQIFAALTDDTECELGVSFVELYNEDLRDLLHGSPDDRCQVQIRETRAGEIVWMGLRQHPVHSAEDMVRLLQEGMAMRQTHETDMNVQSSRSHAIFSITLTRRRRVDADSAGRASPERAAAAPAAVPSTPRPARSQLPRPGPRTPVRTQTPRARATPLRRPPPDETWITTTSKLHFVDLAGSERLKRTAATGERAREGIAINSGLHALGNVISTLSDPARRAAHVPYRDSKLTRLLQDSLGGNAHTLMIACVSSIEGNVTETLNTLQYAQRTRRIRNSVERNQTEEGWDNVEYLQAQVLRLRKELELVKSSSEMWAAPAPATPARAGAEQSSAEQALVALQEKYTALSRKNVQLTAELIQLERRGGPSTGANDFLAAAEPVIVEYEKTVDALEGQLNMLKAAVAYSEDVVHEQEAEIAQLTERAAGAEQQLDVLRGTVRELHEHLEERNARIEALVAQRHAGVGLGIAHADTRRLSLDARRPSSARTSEARPHGGILDYKGRSVSARRYRVAQPEDASPGMAETAAAANAAPPELRDAESHDTTHESYYTARDAQDVPSGARAPAHEAHDTSHDLGQPVPTTPPQPSGLSSELLTALASDPKLDIIEAAERELRQLHDLLDAASPRVQQLAHGRFGSPRGRAAADSSWDASLGVPSPELA